jgi:hypothetical protein
MRTSLTWIIATAALLLSACSDRAFTEFDVLTVEQSACLLDCPVFEVQIFSDGRVRHSGPTFEHTGGAHESRIDRRGLEQIAKALRDARIDEMRDSYVNEVAGCEQTFSDMSTISFSVSRTGGSRNKHVALYTGCVGATVPTVRINTLIKAIDQVTGTTKLLEHRKNVQPAT